MVLHLCGLDVCVIGECVSDLLLMLLMDVVCFKRCSSSVSVFGLGKVVYDFFCGMRW